MTTRPYHHGDLREALVLAGYNAARDGGSSALGVRELAKTVGVSPAAAYRHFRDLDHLVASVSQRAREQLARDMLAAIAAAPAGQGPVAAWARLAASGRAYVRFGVEEPQLLETAFVPCGPTDRPDEPGAWDVLVAAIDELVAAGEVDERRREVAPLIAWSSVHGLATIMARGLIPDDARGPATDAVIAGVRAALVG